MGDLDLDLDDLEVLAKAATPGPWRLRGTFSVSKQAEPGFSGPKIIRDDACYDAADAAYIAAVSPDAVLALIARVRAAEQYRQDLLFTDDHTEDDPDSECADCRFLAAYRAATVKEWRG